MKENRKENKNSNASANQALQKKSEGVSLEPPSKVASIQKKNNVVQFNPPPLKRQGAQANLLNPPHPLERQGAQSNLLAKEAKESGIEPEKDEMANRFQQKREMLGELKESPMLGRIKENPLYAARSNNEAKTAPLDLVDMDNPKKAGDTKPKQVSKTYDDIISTARVSLSFFDKSIKDIAKETNGEAMVGPLKGIPRSMEKINEMISAGSDASELIDVLRASIIYKDMESANASLAKIKESNAWKIVRLKDRMKGETNKDINLSLMLGNGMIAELQLHIKAILQMKEWNEIEGSKDLKGEGRHKVYEVERSLKLVSNNIEQKNKLELELKFEGKPISVDQALIVCNQLQKDMITHAVASKSEGGLQKVDIEKFQSDERYQVMGEWKNQLARLKS